MNFVFARNRTVASVTGRTIDFEKGVPTHVPFQMHKEVIAAGGVPEDELEDDDKQKAPELTAEERVTLIQAAMEDMVAANVREDFTAGGAPHAKKLSDKLGFNVTPQERDTIWEALKQAK